MVHGNYRCRYNKLSLNLLFVVLIVVRCSLAVVRCPLLLLYLLLPDGWASVVLVTGAVLSTDPSARIVSRVCVQGNVCVSRDNWLSHCSRCRCSCCGWQLACPGIDKLY